MAEIADLIASGRGLAKLRELVEAQGGDVGMIDNPDRLPQARLIEDVRADGSGYVAQLNALTVAQASLELGAGRARKTDPIDPAVGIVVHRKIGDQIKAGDVIFTIHADDESQLARAKTILQDAPVYRSRPVEPPPTFYDTITSASME
jgi:pyrimidine-nucleoside phosphorylase